MKRSLHTFPYRKIFLLMAVCFLGLGAGTGRAEPPHRFPYPLPPSTTPKYGNPLPHGLGLPQKKATPSAPMVRTYLPRSLTTSTSAFNRSALNPQPLPPKDIATRISSRLIHPQPQPNKGDAGLSARGIHPQPQPTLPALRRGLLVR